MILQETKWRRNLRVIVYGTLVTKVRLIRLLCEPLDYAEESLRKWLSLVDGHRLYDYTYEYGLPKGRRARQVEQTAHHWNLHLVDVDRIAQ